MATSIHDFFFMLGSGVNTHAVSHKGSNLPAVHGRLEAGPFLWTRVQPAVQRQDRFLTGVQPAVQSDDDDDKAINKSYRVTVLKPKQGHQQIVPGLCFKSNTRPSTNRSRGEVVQRDEGTACRAMGHQQIVPVLCFQNLNKAIDK